MSFRTEKLKVGEFDACRIVSNDFTAVLTTHGARVLSFCPAGGRDVLWGFEPGGKLVRGGVPVCWPWFGKGPVPPSHGFAQHVEWVMAEPEEEADGTVTVIFTLRSDEYGLTARLTVNLGSVLTETLETENISDREFTLTNALHTYFRVSDIEKVRVSGFDGCRCVCNITGRVFTQSGDLLFPGETDDIFYPENRKAVIHDPAFVQKILVERFGSGISVIWTPWEKTAARMGEYAEGEYRNLVCVESVNTREDSRKLAPGAKHTIGTRISLID